MNAQRQFLAVQMEVHHCTASRNAIPGSHTQLRSFPCPPARALIPGHQPLATPDRHNPAGGAVLTIQSACWQINAHFRADAGARSGSARHVLCPGCPGENDDMFHFCQWCATPSTCYSISTEGARLSIDEAALGARYTQFTTSLGNKTSASRREAATTLLGQFLSSRTTGGAVGMTTAQPRDIVQLLCWWDFCSNERRTVVHAMHCRQVGTAELSGCSTQPGECAKRYAHDSLRTNYVAKLAVAYESDLGITTDWSDALRIGNPIRSDLVTQYMTFTREEQKKAGVAVKQAPAVFPSHLHTIVSPLRARLQCTSDPYTRVVLARDLVLFTVAF